MLNFNGCNNGNGLKNVTCKHTHKPSCALLITLTSLGSFVPKETFSSLFDSVAFPLCSVVGCLNWQLPLVMKLTSRYLPCIFVKQISTVQSWNEINKNRMFLSSKKYNRTCITNHCIIGSPAFNGRQLIAVSIYPNWGSLHLFGSFTLHDNDTDTDKWVQTPMEICTSLYPWAVWTPPHYSF